MIAAGSCICHRLGHCLRRLRSPSCRAHGAANRVTCRSGLSKAPGCVVSLRRTGRTSHAYHCLFFRRHPLANQLMAHSEPPTIGITGTAARNRYLRGPQNTPYPPPSATNSRVAEHGRYRSLKREPNLPLRRPIRESPNTEVTDPENEPQTSVFGDARPNRTDHPTLD